MFVSSQSNLAQLSSVTPQTHDSRLEAGSRAGSRNRSTPLTSVHISSVQLLHSTAISNFLPLRQRDVIFRLDSRNAGGRLGAAILYSAREAFDNTHPIETQSLPISRDS